MDIAEKKKLWRLKKKEVKDIFKKHNILKYNPEEIVPEHVLNDLWCAGFSHVYKYLEIKQSENQFTLDKRVWDRCAGPRDCKDCEYDGARDMAEVYSDEWQDNLEPDFIDKCKWLHLYIDRQSWEPTDFNFGVQPYDFAHSPKSEYKMTFQVKDS